MNVLTLFTASEFQISSFILAFFIFVFADVLVVDSTVLAEDRWKIVETKEIAF